MTHQEIINMITPRYFVSEIEDLDSAHMMFDHFEDIGYKIDCSFEIINPKSFKWMEENNCMYESIFKDPNTTIQEKLKELENKLEEHDDQIVQIIQVINQLITPPSPTKKKVGFTID